MGQQKQVAPKFLIFQDKKYWATSRSRYYYRDIRKKGKRIKIALHRYIWELANNKNIPKGYAIHHKDHNVLNNTPNNLFCVSLSEHSKYHSKKIFNDITFRKWNKKHLANIRPLASKWHKSEAGREWHKKHGKATWEKREKKKKLCNYCGKEFECYLSTARFCSHKCDLNARYNSRCYFTDKRICAFCNTEFMANKY